MRECDNNKIHISRNFLLSICLSLNRADIGLYNINIETTSPQYTSSLPYKDNPVHAVWENDCCEKQKWGLFGVKWGSTRLDRVNSIPKVELCYFV